MSHFVQRASARRALSISSSQPTHRMPIMKSTSKATDRVSSQLSRDSLSLHGSCCVESAMRSVSCQSARLMCRVLWSTVAGDQGTKGDQGDQGAKGDQGAQGDQGPQGVAGDQ